MQTNTRANSTHKKRRPARRGQIDYTLLVFVVMLLSIGLVMLFSASSYNASLQTGDSLYYLKRQIFACVLGFAGIFFICKLGYKFICKFAWPIYFVSLTLCVLVMFIGKEVNNSTRWISLGPISFQPSEIGKIAVIILLAVLISKNPRETKSIQGLVKMACVSIVPMFVVVAMNNLSTAIIILVIGGLMLFISSPKTMPFVLLAVAALVAIICFTAFVGYRAQRIKAWLDPEHYDAYQTMQGLYAIGSGGFFGKGLGESVQKQGFVPEAQNDMIFSIVCEELGLFGAMIIISLYVLLIWRLLKIAVNAKNMLGSFLVIGIAIHIATQAVLNIAVVTNTIPNTGVILPFISYGGTSISFLLAEIGVALSVSRGVDVDREE